MLTLLSTLLPASWQSEPLRSYFQQIRSVALVVMGESRAQVYRLADERGSVSFLKISPRPDLPPLADDAARLAWLADRLPVPRVIAYQAEAEADYLLTTAVPGTDAATLAISAGTDTAQVVRLLAAGLRQIHSTPMHDCPFDYRLSLELKRIRGRVAAELVDEANVDERWAELLATAPAQEDLVLTHGDYCLPNIMINGDKVSGFIDLGRAGVGDRYRDLALVRRSLIRNCGEAWVAPFFAAYGLPNPDQAKLIFYQLLDEFH